MIAALVDILVDILYGLHRGADLNIDMGVVFAGQVWVIRHNPAVVEVHGLTVTARYRHADSPQIITAAILRIAVLADDCNWTEALREAL